MIAYIGEILHHPHNTHVHIFTHRQKQDKPLYLYILVQYAKHVRLISIYVHISISYAEMRDKGVSFFFCYFLLFRQEAQPSLPCPVVINTYSDAQLRKVIQQMRQRTQMFKEKVIDPYASSPERSPPVSEYKNISHE